MHARLAIIRILAASLALCVLPVRADVYVIVHPASLVQEITVEQAAALALGRPSGLEDAGRIEFVDQSANEKVFHEFHYRVTGMSQVRLNRHWARQVFTGVARAPRRLGDDVTIMEAVLSNPSLIGYVSAPPPPRYQRLRVVLHLQGEMPGPGQP